MEIELFVWGVGLPFVELLQESVDVLDKLATVLNDQEEEKCKLSSLAKRGFQWKPWKPL